MITDLSDKGKDLIARSWVRFQSNPETHHILDNNLPEPNYKQSLSIDGDVWPYEGSPFDILWDLKYSTPDLAYDIVLKIADLTDDEQILVLLAAGPLEDLISHHENADHYLAKYMKLVAKSSKHQYLLSMVWF